MASCVLDKCCFCVELRTGSLIIGYLNLVWNIIVTLMVIVSMAAVGIVVAQKDNEDAHTIGIAAMIVFGVVLLFVILNLAFIIVLLVGLHKYKRGHVKAYLIYAFIFIIFAIIIFIVSISRGGQVGEIIKYLLNILFSIYFLVVIRSYYLKMDDATRKPAVYNTA